MSTTTTHNTITTNNAGFPPAPSEAHQRTEQKKRNLTSDSYIEQIKKERDAIDGIRLGDYVVIQGNLERICVVMPPTLIQTTDAGSWFLGREGYSEFSGTCINFKRAAEFDRISACKLREIGTKQGKFWTFKNGEVGPGRREDFMVQCRVFEIIN